MIICPKTAAFIIPDAEVFTSSSISDCVSLLTFLNTLLWDSLCKTASTIITAPSTINPKSKAPKLIRLPLTPKVFIRIIANNIDNGMTEATSNPALKLPRNNTNTKTTIKAPSSRLVVTVLMELFTILVRSRKASIITPSGSVFSIWVMRSLMFLMTSLLFSPFSIITTAPDTSCSPLYVIAPYRGALPKRTSPTSRINNGIPLGRFLTTIF